MVLIFLMNILLGNAQVIWQEDFSPYVNGTQNAPTLKWTTSANNCDADGLPGIVADNYWGVRTTSGNKEFCCEDIEGLTCCGASLQGQSDNIWISEVIDISTYITISISMTARVAGSGTVECATCGTGGDYLQGQYSVNGGVSWVPIVTICGANTGYNIASCVNITNEDSLIIRVVLGNQANDEEYYFDNIVVDGTDCSPLPVELSNFEGFYNSEKNVNEIVWGTTSEINNSHFILEYSDDAINWYIAGILLGHGNSNETLIYSTSHESMYNITYYRLQQVDFDGDYEYFEPIVINGMDSGYKIIKCVNLLGQEIDINSKGHVFIIYSNNTIKHVFNN